MKIRPLGVEMFHADGQTDRQTDRQTERYDESNSSFSHFFGTSKNACIYSGPASYDRLNIRPTWVTTKIFILTYDQISSYDPRQRQRGEHISGITCSSLRALAVFACFAGATMLIPLIKVCTV
jgi:hypothetical protein